MKFLLVTDGTWGDTLPFIFLAITLRDAGHEVIIFTNEFYRSYIESHGLSFVATTTLAQRKECLENEDLWHPIKGMHVIGHYVGVLFTMMLPEIEKHIDNHPVIVAHSFSYAAKTIAEKHNLDFVTLLISPIQLRTSHRFPMMHGGKTNGNLPPALNGIIYPLVDRFIIDKHFNPIINIERKKLGLEPIKGFAHWTTFDNQNVALWPSWYAPLEPDQKNAVCVGFPKHVEIESEMDPTLLDWMKSGSAPIVVTMGSGYLFSEHLQSTIVSIAITYGIRFILVGLYKNTSNLPDSMRAYTHVQFSKILPYAEFVIHHGGAGTLAQTTVSGKPHLVIPMSHDQPDNAYYIMKNNLGSVLWKIKPTADELYEAIMKIRSSPSIFTSCQNAQNAVQTENDGIQEAASYLIENFSKKY